MLTVFVKIYKLIEQYCRNYLTSPPSQGGDEGVVKNSIKNRVNK